MELREKRACGGCSARVGKKKGGAKRRDKGNIEITNLTGFYSPVFPFFALVSRWFRVQRRRGRQRCARGFLSTEMTRGFAAASRRRASSSNRLGVKERRTNDAAMEQMERKEKERVKRRGKRKKGGRKDRGGCVIRPFSTIIYIYIASRLGYNYDMYAHIIALTPRVQAVPRLLDYLPQYS